ncbi:unnamed protein product [Trichogramma brassicae]|uniref:Uncharacterized protein n=1 Tax=Trichogramma brassicae TaxID=86971 RepID=A0A6H5IKR8_9HYME|nr:unnamed protein product [Trichogramma brassicae]
MFAQFILTYTVYNIHLRESHFKWEDREWSRDPYKLAHTHTYTRNNYAMRVAHYSSSSWPRQVTKTSPTLINGKPSPRRTTPVHHAFGQNEFFECTDQIQKLFEIYMRFDVNYIDEFGLTHFHVACKLGLHDVVKKFLELGRVDPNCLVPVTGDSPLHLALMYEQRRSVELLLKRGAKPNAANKAGLTPLHIVCKHFDGNVELANMLFELSDEKYHPVLVNAQDKLGETPLHVTLRQGNKMMTESLLRRGANPNIVDKEGSTPLHFICSRYHVDFELAELFFRINHEIQQTVRINAQNKSGRAPLHQAVARRNDSLVELLLRRGADSNLADNEGSTPLHFICNRPDLDFELAELFFRINNEIQQTVQIDARDKLGWTSLHRVVHRGSKEYTRLLLRNGADPNLAKKDGSTPLHIICKSHYVDNVELAKILFELSDEKCHPVQIDARDELGNTPLHLAVSRGYRGLLELLLRAGANPNLVNDEGSTALHIVCRTDYDDSFAEVFFEIIDKVNQRVLQVDALDKEGRTPLQWAVTSLKPDTVDVLLNRGADLSNFFFPMWVISTTVKKKRTSRLSTYNYRAFTDALSLKTYTMSCWWLRALAARLAILTRHDSSISTSTSSNSSATRNYWGTLRRTIYNTHANTRTHTHTHTHTSEQSGDISAYTLVLCCYSSSSSSIIALTFATLVATGQKIRLRKYYYSAHRTRWRHIMLSRRRAAALAVLHAMYPTMRLQQRKKCVIRNVIYWLRYAALIWD